MPIDYSDLGEPELLRRRNAIDAALDGGSQTGVGIEAGVRHEFAAMKPSDLRLRRDEYQYGLFLINPTKYKNPYDRPRTTQVRHNCT